MDDTPIHDPRSPRWVGVTFTNPVSGERIEVLDVDVDANGGESGLRGRLTVEPGGIGPPRHVHPHQRERFTVESGELTVFLDDETRQLSTGDTVTVPPETAHGFENRSSSPVVFLGEIHPGSDLIPALSTLAGLACEGKTRDDGNPSSFLQAMVFAQRMRDALYLASPPRGVQEALWTVFAPIGRMLGYQATYDRFLRPSFWEQAAQDA